MNKLDEEYKRLDEVCEKVMEEDGTLRKNFAWHYIIDKQAEVISKLGGTREEVFAIINKYHKPE